MNIKNLMKFYFGAGGLERALDGVSMRTALQSCRDPYRGCEEFAERIIEITEVKKELGKLWARLDGILGAMTVNDRLTLKRYAFMRGGAVGEEKREVHRAVVKFTRRAGGLLSGGVKPYKIMCSCLCLIGSAPD